MAQGLNRVQLIGNLGRDPEIKTLSSGAKVASLRVATSESWKDKTTGERRERVEWHTVQVWGDGLIDQFIARFLRKGSRVMVEGALSTRKWQDQSGADRYSTEIVIRPFAGLLMGLDRPEGNGGAQGGDPGPSGPGAGSGHTGGRDYDDEIPF